MLFSLKMVEKEWRANFVEWLCGEKYQKSLKYIFTFRNFKSIIKVQNFT